MSAFEQLFGDDADKRQLHLPALGQVDPRELSPHVPVLWRDFAPGERPYASPEEEYVRSPFPIAMKVVRERWSGLISEDALGKLKGSAELRAQRFRYQDEIAREAFKQSFAGDVEFQKRRIDQEIIDICDWIEQVQSNVQEGAEYAPSKGAGPLGYVRRPLSVESLTKLGGLRIALSEALSKRLGLATEIVRVEVGPEETLEARISRFMSDADPKFAALARVVNAGTLTGGALPALEGASFESEVRFQAEAGRVIELLPEFPPKLGSENEHGYFQSE